MPNNFFFLSLSSAEDLYGWTIDLFISWSYLLNLLKIVISSFTPRLAFSPADRLNFQCLSLPHSRNTLDISTTASFVHCRFDWLQFTFYALWDIQNKTLLQIHNAFARAVVIQNSKLAQGRTTHTILNHLHYTQPPSKIWTNPSTITLNIRPDGKTVCLWPFYPFFLPSPSN